MPCNRYRCTDPALLSAMLAAACSGSWLGATLQHVAHAMPPSPRLSLLMQQQLAGCSAAACSALHSSCCTAQSADAAVAGSVQLHCSHPGMPPLGMLKQQELAQCGLSTPYPLGFARVGGQPPVCCLSRRSVSESWWRHRSQLPVPAAAIGRPCQTRPPAAHQPCPSAIRSWQRCPLTTPHVSATPC